MVRSFLSTGQAQIAGRLDSERKLICYAERVVVHDGSEDRFPAWRRRAAAVPSALMDLGDDAR